jgi:aryl-alcohol dehydrogenase-like predicted oxidoreductase
MSSLIRQRLCLGTVQFGLEYGINNKKGKPSRDEVFAMLDYGLAQGIEYLDTAAAYGDAEQRLGEYFLSRKAKDQVKVISKLLPNLIPDDCTDAEARVINEVKGSLARLHLDCLDGYLLHTPANFYNPGIMAGLVRAREMGLIKNLGVSIYETKHALDVAGSGLVDYIQVPYNIFDQRLEKTEFFDLTKANGVTVFGRAPFLQGLLFMSADQVPENMARAKPYLDEFAEVLDQYSFTREEACMLFSLQNLKLDKVVFGVDDMEQLKADMEVAARDCSDDSLRRELQKHFITMEKEIIFPSLWAKKD